MIGLQEAKTAMDFQKQLIFNEGFDSGRDQGIEQGIEQGEFVMALKIKEELGIEKALELSNFSRSELESGK